MLGALSQEGEPVNTQGPHTSGGIRAPRGSYNTDGQLHFQVSDFRVWVGPKVHIDQVPLTLAAPEAPLRTTGTEKRRWCSRRGVSGSLVLYTTQETALDRLQNFPHVTWPPTALLCGPVSVYLGTAKASPQTPGPSPQAQAPSTHSQGQQWSQVPDTL